MVAPCARGGSWPASQDCRSPSHCSLFRRTRLHCLHTPRQNCPTRSPFLPGNRHSRTRQCPRVCACVHVCVRALGFRRGRLQGDAGAWTRANQHSGAADAAAAYSCSIQGRGLQEEGSRLPVIMHVPYAHTQIPTSGVTAFAGKSRT